MRETLPGCCILFGWYLLHERETVCLPLLHSPVLTEHGKLLLGPCSVCLGSGVRVLACIRRQTRYSRGFPLLCVSTLYAITFQIRSTSQFAVVSPFISTWAYVGPWYGTSTISYSVTFNMDRKTTRKSPTKANRAAHRDKEQQQRRREIDIELEAACCAALLAYEEWKTNGRKHVEPTPRRDHVPNESPPMMSGIGYWVRPELAIPTSVFEQGLGLFECPCGRGVPHRAWLSGCAFWVKYRQLCRRCGNKRWRRPVYMWISLTPGDGEGDRKHDEEGCEYCVKAAALGRPLCRGARKRHAWAPGSRVLPTGI